MPRPILPPRLRFWRGHWYLIYFDPVTRREVRKSCWRMGAEHPDQRKALLQLTKDQIGLKSAETVIAGGNLSYGTNLRDAVQRFLEDVMQRAHTAALKASSAQRLRETVGHFKDWLPPHLKTADLDGPTLGRFLRGLDRTPGTINVYRRNLKTCLRWLCTVRPRMFPDPDIFWPALKLAHVEQSRPEAFTPQQLRDFRDALSEDQRPLFTFLALTGARLAEANGVTAQNNLLIIMASKTGRRRYLPLVGAPEGDVAPKLAKRLKLPLPKFRVQSWRTAARRAGVYIMPQRLRRNFVSYCASMGFPASVVADWCGHSVQVSERHYRGQVLDRRKGASLESAMGL